eukprot:12774501-Ditylum_brightwellii.AAC.1
MKQRAAFYWCCRSAFGGWENGRVAAKTICLHKQEGCLPQGLGGSISYGSFESKEGRKQK